MALGLRAPRGGMLTDSPQAKERLGALQQEQQRSDAAIGEAAQQKQFASQEVDKAASGMQGITEDYLRSQKPVEEFRPRQLDAQSMSDFAGIATALAALGAKAVKGDITVALSAAAGAMNGFAKGNLDAARLDMEQFNTKMKSAIAENERMQNRYKAIMEDRKLSLQQKMQAYNVAAHEYNDVVAIAAIREGRLQHLLDRDDRITAGTNQLNAQREIMERQFSLWDKRIQAQKDAAAARGGTGNTGMSEDALDNMAAYLIQNGRLPQGMARMGPNAQAAIANRVAELVQKAGLSPQEFAAQGPIVRQKLGALLQFEKQRNAIQAYEGMLNLNIDILKDLSKRVQRTDSPYANKPVLWLQQNASGDPDVAEYLFQVNTVSTEIARVLNNPNLTGQLTDSARAELQGVVRGELNPEQMDRVLTRAQADAKNRVKSIDTQYDKLIDEIKNPLRQAAPSSPSEGGEIESQVKAAGWSYEPTKYDYRVVNGKVQRKPK